MHWAKPSALFTAAFCGKSGMLWGMGDSASELGLGICMGATVQSLTCIGLHHAPPDTPPSVHADAHACMRRQPRRHCCRLKAGPRSAHRGLRPYPGMTLPLLLYRRPPDGLQGERQGGGQALARHAVEGGVLSAVPQLHAAPLLSAHGAAPYQAGSGRP